MTPARVIGSYQVMGSLGRRGRAFRAWDSDACRCVAVTLPLDGSDPSRFEVAATGAASLSHSHIVNIVEVGAHNGIPFVATEFVQGRSFADLIRTSTQTDPAEILRHVADLCEALAFALAHGTIYRPFEPEHAIVSRAGELALVGTGIDDSAGNDQAGGRPPTDEGQLALAVGATLYELLAVPALHASVGPGLFRAPLSVVRPDLELTVATLADEWAAGSYASRPLTALAADARAVAARVEQPVVAVAPGPEEIAVESSQTEPMLVENQVGAAVEVADPELGEFEEAEGALLQSDLRIFEANGETDPRAVEPKALPQQIGPPTPPIVRRRRQVSRIPAALVAAALVVLGTTTWRLLRRTPGVPAEDFTAEHVATSQPAREPPAATNPLEESRPVSPAPVKPRDAQRQRNRRSSPPRSATDRARDADTALRKVDSTTAVDPATPRRLRGTRAAAPSAPTPPERPARASGAAASSVLGATVTPANEPECLESTAIARILICEVAAPRAVLTPVDRPTPAETAESQALTGSARVATPPPAQAASVPAPITSETAASNVGPAPAPGTALQAFSTSPNTSTASHQATRAALVTIVRPNYPEEAKQLGITGSVEVDLTIDQDGRVVRAAAVSGPTILRTAAESALRGWRFRPASVNGTPVGSRRSFLISFDAPVPRLPSTASQTAR